MRTNSVNNKISNNSTQKTNGGKFMCKFDDVVIGQITGGGGGDTDSDGGGEC